MGLESLASPALAGAFLSSSATRALETLGPPTLWEHSEKFAPQEGPHPATLILDARPPTPEPREIKFCRLHGTQAAVSITSAHRSGRDRRASSVQMRTATSKAGCWR
ncbi:unnamed protein product [Rangifer tarandus platyrhynchus]|uniref:Uncharacterized protein n=1 Tax=Rangifer tarandus platyrhynchus TaxID=3082113 RepID=A0ABN8Y4Y5_RANTA|nr:unnamed protein product [Rangifer tarandus platyrhynchus]